MEVKTWPPERVTRTSEMAGCSRLPRTHAYPPQFAAEDCTQIPNTHWLTRSNPSLQIVPTHGLFVHHLAKNYFMHVPRLWQQQGPLASTR